MTSDPSLLSSLPLTFVLHALSHDCAMYMSHYCNKTFPSCGSQRLKRAGGSCTMTTNRLKHTPSSVRICIAGYFLVKNCDTHPFPAYHWIFSSNPVLTHTLSFVNLSLDIFQPCHLLRILQLLLQLQELLSVLARLAPWK